MKSMKVLEGVANDADERRIQRSRETLETQAGNYMRLSMEKYSVYSTLGR